MRYSYQTSQEQQQVLQALLWLLLRKSNKMGAVTFLADEVLDVLQSPEYQNADIQLMWHDDPAAIVGGRTLTALALGGPSIIEVTNEGNGIGDPAGRARLLTPPVDSNDRAAWSGGSDSSAIEANPREQLGRGHREDTQGD